MLAQAPMASTSRVPYVCLSAAPMRSLSCTAPVQKTQRKPMWSRRSPFLPFIDASGTYKTYSPLTPGMRRLKKPNHPHLHRGGPIIALTIPRTKQGGRDKTGKVVTRGRGGEHKRKTRLVDTRRTEEGPQDVVRIEFDPNRSGHIALLRNRYSGMLSYILAVEGLRAGDVVQSWPNGLNVNKAVDAALSTSAATAEGIANAAARLEGGQGPAMPAELTSTIALSNLHANGNCLQLRDLPLGQPICNIALHPRQGGQLCRSAGSSGTLVAFEVDPSPWAHVQLSSGEIRRIDKTCVATIGKVSNAPWGHQNRGKAGRNRWLGKRPKVAARAMNSVDHPLGGTGRNSRNKQPMSRTMVHAKGTKTRRPTSHKGNKQVVKTRGYTKKYLPRREPAMYTSHGKPSAVVKFPIVTTSTRT